MIKKSLLSVALAGFAFSALAVPAKQGVLEYPQPDGTFLQITLHGDEFHAWYETADGYVVLPASDGFMEYATLKAGKIQSTGVRAYNIKERTASQKQLLASIPQQQLMETVRKENSVQQAAMRAQQRLGGVGYINNYPRFGSPKAMVLLVEFKDIKLQPESTREAFQDLVSKPGYSYNGATGSALDYFTHQSKGKFTPDFQVFGPITLPQNEAFYGAEAGTAHDVNPQQMVIDACNILRQQQPDLDWSEFDNDGDGYVDSIFVFFAGYGQNHGAEDWRI
ncbi:MAG: immune inhibitor A, partial [Muribaculaceae bacterium]|nr:immune inhibitor A [Muribaculaceae bacterium]